ncbi:MAG: RNA polymerase sigma factor [Marinisporobacter sp.]|jgi:RNA polymerase sigma factor (sigma-70 family)|nr:RNA polymerase sigma factor [Marinisporobacter sp.]
MGLYYLLQRVQRGDEEAVANIYLKFKPTIKKLSRNLSYEEAETDLIIAFLETIREIEIDKLHVKSDGVVINYIYTFLKNKSINLFKKNILQRTQTTQLDLDILVDDALIDVDSNIFIANLLISLPVLQREVLKKKFIQDFSYKEIAKLLGISRQAVNRAKNRGLMNLRKILNIKKEGENWKKRYSS